MKKLISFLFLCFYTVGAFAYSADKPLDDSRQEAQAVSLFYEIRCVVCRGESIADSQASVAGDMRRSIRRRIAAGESGEEIKASLVGEYGDTILMQPPFKAGTVVLWAAPVIVFAAGASVLWSVFRNNSAKT